MKRLFIALSLVIGIAFVLITLTRHSGPAAEPVPADADSAERGRIRDFWAAYHEATRLRVEGSFEQAAEAYRRALQFDPRHEESLYYLGNCLLELGDYRAAGKIYRTMTEMNPSSKRAFGQLGIVLSTPEPGVDLDLEGAEAAFLRNIEINREESGPFLRLGSLELLRGRLDEGLARFETAAGFRSPEGLFMAGWVLFRQGKVRQAAEHFRRVLEIEAHEASISGRGASSEGDLASNDDALSPLQAAALKARVFLRWLSPEDPSVAKSPSDFVALDRQDGRRVELVNPQGLTEWANAGRGAVADFDGDGNRDLALARQDKGLLVLRGARGGKGWVKDFAVPGMAWDVVWGDYDGDGDPDLYVIGSGWTGREANRLFRVDCDPSTGSDCHFLDVTAAAGLEGMRNTAVARFLDYDGDGALDLVEVGSGEQGLRLLRNQGGGRFRETSETAGIQFEGTAVDVAAGDVDGDHDVDLFVLRWKRPALLYVNQGDGLFREESEEWGLETVGGDALSALLFDYDRDGWMDLLVATHASWELALRCLLNPRLSASRQTPKLMRNLKGRRFEDVTDQAGLNRSWGVTQAVAVDFDGDGWTDLLFGNGSLQPWRLEPSVALRNEEGRRFSEYARIPRRGVPARAIGAQAFDCDGDGRPEAFLAVLGWIRFD